MVRKNPLVERGPAPPGGRPQQPEPYKYTQPASIFELRPETEYEHLWHHAKLAASMNLNSLILYVDLEMPGADIEDLKRLRDQLDNTINKHEARSDEQRSEESVSTE